MGSTTCKATKVISEGAWGFRVQGFFFPPAQLTKSHRRELVRRTVKTDNRRGPGLDASPHEGSHQHITTDVRGLGFRRFRGSRFTGLGFVPSYLVKTNPHCRAADYDIASN